MRAGPIVQYTCGILLPVHAYDYNYGLIGNPLMIYTSVVTYITAAMYLLLLPVYVVITVSQLGSSSTFNSTRLMRKAVMRGYVT